MELSSVIKHFSFYEFLNFKNKTEKPQKNDETGKLRNLCTYVPYPGPGNFEGFRVSRFLGFGETRKTQKQKITVTGN